MSNYKIFLLKILYKKTFKNACKEILEGRLIDSEGIQPDRFLRKDIENILETLWEKADELIPLAELEKLPNFGNKHNVFLAVITIAAYHTLLSFNVAPKYARVLVSDIGWKVYSKLFLIIFKPVSLTTRKPQKRLERTLKILMVFPFSAPGRPGYEVDTKIENEKYYTCWTHCPPQTFVRNLIEKNGDRGELELFSQSWCQYDWPGADLLTGGNRGNHYERPHTMSKGDNKCDMCWYAKNTTDVKEFSIKG